jgi:RNA polymerase sigma-70 factor (ECF subfamily)
MAETELEPVARGQPVGSPADLSDRTLLHRFRHGQEDAATQLYERYAHRLRALAQSRCRADLAGRVDADDIVQSVFGRFFRAAREGFYEVPAGEDLWNLFLVMALNKIRTLGAFHRAAKRDVRLTCGGEDFERPQEPALWRDDGAGRFLRLAVEEALEQLPAAHKQMVQLRIDGHEVAEIARLAGRSKRTVERLLQEARRRLADVLDWDE